MSTKFTKILIYVVLAITIVVTAVCAAILIAGGAGTDVSVDVHYLSRTAADNDVTVKINGQETNELRVKEGSTVTLTFETVGYDFEGWFAGNEGEWSTASEALESEVSYSFTVEESTKITAVFDATKYEVSFNGVEGVQNGTYTYGQKLPVPSMTGTQAFIGWTDGVDEDGFIATMPAINGKELALTATTVDYASYNYLLNVPASKYVTAGQIQYTYSAGINLSEALNPSRDYYSISAVVVNGETIELTDADIKNKIINELVESNVINSSNYQNATIIVPANVVWTCDVTEVVVELDAPFNETFDTNFTFTTLDTIEEIVVSDRFKDSYQKDKFKISKVNEFFENGISWADGTIKDLFDVLASYNVELSGSVTITIDLDEILTA